MGKKLVYERYHWFHGQTRAGRYPNARKLSEKFEISEKQAQRDKEFIRDRLYAPLLYNAFEKGYEYENVGYELPPIWLKEDELLAFQGGIIRQCKEEAFLSPWHQPLASLFQHKPDLNCQENPGTVCMDDLSLATWRP